MAHEACTVEAVQPCATPQPQRSRPAFAMHSWQTKLTAYHAPRACGSPKRGTLRYLHVRYTVTFAGGTLSQVQRLFSIFPAGWPGFALLLLRASVAMALLLEIVARRHGLSIWITGASLAVCTALSAGFLTPIVAAIALGLHVLIWSSLNVDNPGTAAIIGIDAIALALLGPGAYSFDSRRFGRRLIVQTPP
jgi:hypothetical protein